MKKAKRIFALAGAVILIALYLLTFLFSLMDSDLAHGYLVHLSHAHLSSRSSLMPAFFFTDSAIKMTVKNKKTLQNCFIFLQCFLFLKGKCHIFGKNRRSLHHLPDRIRKIDSLFVNCQNFIFFQTLNGHSFRPEQVTPSADHTSDFFNKGHITFFAFQSFFLIFNHISRT